MYHCLLAVVGVWLLDIISGTVVQDPHAHFLPRWQGIHTNGYIVHLGAKAFIRFQAKAVLGPGSFFMLLPVLALFLHPITPKTKYARKKGKDGRELLEKAKKKSAVKRQRIFVGKRI